jgi:hypothetical protein
MTDSNDKSIVDTIENLTELYRDNEDKIKKFIGDGTADISRVDPLTEVHWEDDKVVVMFNEVDVSGGISMSESEEGVEFDIGEESVDIEMPDDINFGNHDIQMNNGVLTATFDRSE